MKQYKKRPKAVLLFSKTMVCEILNVDYSDLKNCISEETKKKVEWRDGVQRFRDDQVFWIIKDFRRLATDAEIKQMIYPKGY